MLDQTRTKSAALYRMVTPEHICPFGLKSLDLLERQGFEIEDHQLKSRAETDALASTQRPRPSSRATELVATTISAATSMNRSQIRLRPAINPSSRVLRQRWRCSGSDLGRERNLGYAARRRMVRCLQHVHPGDPEAAGPRDVLEHVPGLRSLGSAVRAICVHLPVWRGDRRRPDDRRRPAEVDRHSDGLCHRQHRGSVGFQGGRYGQAFRGDMERPTGSTTSSIRGAREARRNSAPGRARHKPSNHCAGKAKVQKV